MTRRTARPPPGPIWLFALLLLLRAAMPFLADASAQREGVALSEVCSVHGIALASAPSDRRDPHAGSAADVAGKHCALGALGALGAASLPPGLSVRGTSTVVAAASSALATPWPDAAATWVARNKHGPPAKV